MIAINQKESYSQQAKHSERKDSIDYFVWSIKYLYEKGHSIWSINDWLFNPIHLSHKFLCERKYLKIFHKKKFRAQEFRSLNRNRLTFNIYNDRLEFLKLNQRNIASELTGFWFFDCCLVIVVWSMLDWWISSTKHFQIYVFEIIHSIVSESFYKSYLRIRSAIQNFKKQSKIDESIINHFIRCILRLNH